MVIVIDPDSEKMAVGLTTETSDAPAEFDADRGFELPYHDVKIHVLKQTTSAQSSFLAGLFGLDAEATFATVIHEVRRYTIEPISDDREVLVGISARLIATTKSDDLNVELSIPNLSAAGQLDRLDTKIAIHVAGYNSALGGLLPQPDHLDVETFMDFSQAFNRIQEALFKTEAEVNYSPRPLEYRDRGEL